MSLSAAIHLEDVLFGYTPRTPVIQIDELKVGTGRRAFVHGPSGSGKTTLLGLITGVLAPQRGRCMVLGKDMAKMSASARDRHRGSEMGYIFQSFNLIPYLTVRQNVALPCQVHKRRREQIVASTPAEEVERLVTRLGLESHLDQNVKKLSTGQQQRVAIARAVIGKPHLVIADEPTSALDAERRKDFLKLLFEVCDEAQATLVFVSHDRSLMEQFDERIALPEMNKVRS